MTTLMLALCLNILILGVGLRWYSKAASKMAGCLTVHASALKHLQESVLRLQEIEITRQSAMRRHQRRADALAATSWTNWHDDYDPIAQTAANLETLETLATLYPVADPTPTPTATRLHSVGTPIGDSVAESIRALPVQSVQYPTCSECDHLPVTQGPDRRYYCAEHRPAELWELQP